MWALTREGEEMTKRLYVVHVVIPATTTVEIEATSKKTAEREAIRLLRERRTMPDQLGEEDIKLDLDLAKAKATFPREQAPPVPL